MRYREKKSDDSMTEESERKKSRGGKKVSHEKWVALSAGVLTVSVRFFQPSSARRECLRRQSDKQKKNTRSSRDGRRNNTQKV